MGAEGSFFQRVDKGQLVKWTVYSLLLLNFVYYAIEEYYIASHTLRHGGTLLQWMEEFATTIDELAWFGLLFAFEFETYILEDDAWKKRWLPWLLHGIRLVCYIMLAHTVLARIVSYTDTMNAPVAENVTSVCQVTDQDVSWGYNYRYEIITPENCDSFSDDDHYVMLDPSVITDSAGFERERHNTFVDLSDAITWLLVIWSIELAVWLQNRNITGGRLMLASHAAKFFYGILFLHMSWWAYIGHWLYAWDQFLWIAGFWAIENNLSEWRDEIRAETGASVAEGAPG